MLVQDGRETDCLVCPGCIRDGADKAPAKLRKGAASMRKQAAELLKQADLTDEAANMDLSFPSWGEFRSFIQEKAREFCRENGVKEDIDEYYPLCGPKEDENRVGGVVVDDLPF